MNNQRLQKSKDRQAKAKSQARDAKRSSKKQEVVAVAPVAMSSTTKWKAPKVEYAKDGSYCIISHKERIGTVLGSVAFTATSFSINPGLVSTFPWLSAIANRFESHSWIKCDFLFKTKTSTTAVGDVILAVDYDASDSAPSSSVQVESYQSFVDGAPWQNLVMRCKPSDLNKLKQRFNRDATVATGSDVKLYDAGNFYICTENQASAALVGYLYVEYTVKLFTPQLRSSDFYISGGYIDGLTGSSAANPMGSAPDVDADARGISCSAASVVTIANPGEYIVAMQLTGTTITALTLTAGTNCTVTSRFGTTINGAATSANRCYKVVVSSFNATMTVSCTAATASECQLNIASQPLNSFALFVSDFQHESGCQVRVLADGLDRSGLKVLPKYLSKVPCTCAHVTLDGKPFSPSTLKEAFSLIKK